jgi:catalase
MSDQKPPKLTNEAGNPVTDNKHSQVAGPYGPTLLQDVRLIEKLAHFNRERIPERIVHAVGSGAYGYFEPLDEQMSKWSKAAVFKPGTRTEVFVRFSTVAGSRGAPDTARDPRGFAVKMYTSDGNWDLTGNNTPVFFIRDGIKFPDFIHSQKYDPHTNRQEPNNIWDFFSLSPEATHQFVWLFGDRGIPASYLNMDGFGSHTFMVVNDAGERNWVKFHFKTDHGIKTLTSEEAAKIGGEDPQYMQKDLYDNIKKGNFPSWTLKVQVMAEQDAYKYRFDPFDVTKVWPYKDYPLIPVGKMVLNKAPESFFAEVEQAAFDPGNMPPGIGPSPDRMLQARLFAYGDAHRYRLGINHTQLPVNAPKGVKGGAQNYSRDGAMKFTDNHGGEANYEPNSRGGPAATGEKFDFAMESSGATGPQDHPHHKDNDDFVQAGALYNVMDEDAKQRLVSNIAGSLGQVTLSGVIERSISNFEKADADFGKRLREALKK